MPSGSPQYARRLARSTRDKGRPGIAELSSCAGVEQIRRQIVRPESRACLVWYSHLTMGTRTIYTAQVDVDGSFRAPQPYLGHSDVAICNVSLG